MHLRLDWRCRYCTYVGPPPVSRLRSTAKQWSGHQNYNKYSWHLKFFSHFTRRPPASVPPPSSLNASLGISPPRVPLGGGGRLGWRGTVRRSCSAACGAAEGMMGAAMPAAAVLQEGKSGAAVDSFACLAGALASRRGGCLLQSPSAAVVGGRCPPHPPPQYCWLEGKEKRECWECAAPRPSTGPLAPPSPPPQHPPPKFSSPRCRPHPHFFCPAACFRFALPRRFFAHPVGFFFPSGRLTPGPRTPPPPSSPSYI